MSELSSDQLDKGWNFINSAENEAILKPLCQRAEKLFELPARRLCRYFAYWDDPCFARGDHLGPYFRGFHVRRDPKDSQQQYTLPEDLWACFRVPLDELGDVDWNSPPEDLFAFDDLIYVRPSTCREPTGCVITYAHELQHFVQRDHFPKSMKMNSRLREVLRDANIASRQAAKVACGVGSVGEFTEIDLPAERDANIASKRVAEVVCGVEAVRKFAEEQIRFMKQEGATDQVTRWTFFLDISSCDLRGETLELANKHKKALADLGIDVDQPGLLDD